MSVKKGCVLMHSHVTHAVDMPPGPNGFRCWTDVAPPNDAFKPCRCGWSGLPHYSIAPNEPCWTWEKLGLDRQEVLAAGVIVTEVAARGHLTGSDLPTKPRSARRWVFLRRAAISELVEQRIAGRGPDCR
jgi:hypothetical protein